MDTTLSELRDKISGDPDSDDSESEECNSEVDHIHLYFHGGDEILFDDSLSLSDVFGGDNDDEEALEIEVDYRCLEAGWVDISCEGGSVEVLDYKGQLVTIGPQPTPTQVYLARKHAYVS